MKVVLNNDVDFAELEMDCIPREGETIFYRDEDYVVYSVEWCLGNVNHVNLMLSKVIGEINADSHTKRIKLLSENPDLNGRCVAILKAIDISTECELVNSGLGALDIMKLPQGGKKSVVMIMDCIDNLLLCYKADCFTIVTENIGSVGNLYIRMS